MQWLKDAAASLRTQSYGQLAEHAIVAGSIIYLANKLRKVKLSQLLNVIPGAKGAVDAQIDKETTKAVEELLPAELERSQTLVLPEQGRSAAQVLGDLKQWKQFDADGRGRAFAYVYDNDDAKVQETVTAAANMYIHSNALSPLAFPSLRKMEVETVAMTLNLLNANAQTAPNACGTLTSGGTESLMCAVKAYRDRARDLWPHITAPEMVLPVTAHPALPKAAHNVDVKCVWVPVDPATSLPDMKAYEAAITPNTILLVGSAPSYPHGVMDPIGAIAQLALQRKLPCHVDGCVGGLLLPFVEKLGYPVPAWDFRVPGVTSISADLHKFGYTHKGASVLAWREFRDRKYQFFAFSDWPGGLFVSPSMLGTRSGSAIAAAYTTLVSLGMEGYMRLAKQTMDAAKKFQAGIAAIPGLKLIGTPVMSITSFTVADPSGPLNIHVVADTMETQYRWKLERQHKPASVHLTVMPTHFHTADAFLADLRKAVDYARAHPELTSEGSAAMYGMAAKIPDNVLLDSFLVSFMGKVFVTHKPTDAVAASDANAAAAAAGAGAGASAAAKK